MTTAELERLLETALHEADRVAVDVAAGRRRLLGRREARKRNVRRLAVTLAAVFALLAAAGAALVIWIRGAADEPPPIHRPHVVTFSPSGLPVGLLKGTYPLGRDVGTIRLLVRNDGTGQFEFTERLHHGPFGPFDIDLLGSGTGKAAMRAAEGSLCDDPAMLTLTFAAAGSTVTIVRADAPGTCVVGRSEAAALSGTILRVLPSPRGGLGAEP